MNAANKIARFLVHWHPAMESGRELPHSKAVRAKHFAPAFGVRRYFAAFAARSTCKNTPAIRQFVIRVVGHKLFALAALIGVGIWFLVIPAVTGGLGANPPEKLLHRAGEIAIWTLGAVLSLSPLRVLFPRSRLVNALNRHRRAIGVSACVYGLIHFGFHLLYEGDVQAIARSFYKPFIWFGLAGLSILVILAASSNSFSIRKLGGKNWKRLHRLTYAAAAVLIYHQAIAGKGHWHIARWLLFSLLALQIVRVSVAFARRRNAATVTGGGDPALGKLVTR
jgi:methionine sulfoxide reductase heme-binding subunit